MAMVVVEEDLAIGVEVPDDDDVENHDDENGPREVIRSHQLVELDGEKERRFPDGEPAGPRGAKEKADSLHQREKAQKDSAPGRTVDIGLGQLVNALRQTGEEFVLWIDS